MDELSLPEGAPVEGDVRSLHDHHLGLGSSHGDGFTSVRLCTPSLGVHADENDNWPPKRTYRDV